MVPESAVINSGDRRLVFVDHEGGLLEPREVQLGVKNGGRLPGPRQASGRASGS